jgi:hypothetical protein
MMFQIKNANGRKIHFTKNAKLSKGEGSQHLFLLWLRIYEKGKGMAQPGEAWIGQCAQGLALFDVSPLR